MWKGCLLLLVALGAGLYLELRLVTERELPAPWLAAGVLGLGVMLLAGSLHGLFDAFRKQLRPETDPTAWQDGQQVRVGGVVRATRQSLRAPFSERDAVLFEYKVWQSLSKGSEVSEPKREATINAAEMAPCTLITSQGSVALRGFPSLMHIPLETYGGEDLYPRAAREIVRNHWKVASVRAALDMVGAGLSGDAFQPLMHWMSVTAVARLIAPEGEPCAASYEGGPQPELQGEQAEAELVRRMRTRAWMAQEQSIANGAEVTVEGTYDAASRSVDIAQGIGKLNHTIRLGLAAQTASREVRQAIWFIAIFGAILAGLHWVVYADGGALYRRLIEELW